MQTPLDRYRILGIPYQATSEQIQQAYRDRQQQQPIGGYSPSALASREALLAATCQELTDPERRAAYDRTLSAAGAAAQGKATKRLPALPPTQLEAVLARECRRRQGPTLEIPSEQFLGALLLLVEMGEYALVQEIARACFQDEGALEQLQIPRSDLALVAALASRERGRELWQRRHYRQAAAQLEMARQLAETEAIGTMVRQEVGDDLCRLRPYEIWELLTTPKRTEATTERALTLLDTMLDARGGMDGTSALDGSGLSATEFLRFIQQLRPYLDAEEQFRLFERESRRPSGTAACLLAYTQIARGFVGFRPEFLLEAASILEKIGQRRPHQDVQIEKAVCALLLGRTEAATEVLRQSRDRKALDAIYQASKGAPDLLPGLCEFAKQWLGAEVLPEFRDLSQRRVSLAEYFADRQVQAALDRLAEAPAMRQRRRQPQRRPATLREAEAEAMPMASGYSQRFYPVREEGGERSTNAVATVAALSTAGTMQPGMAGMPGSSGGFSETAPVGGGGAGSPSDRDEPRFVPFVPGKKRRRARQHGPLPRPVAATKVPVLGLPQQILASWALAAVGAVGVAIAVAGIWGARTPQEEATVLREGEQLLVRLDAPPPILADVLVEAAVAEASPVAPNAKEAPAATLEKWLTAKAQAYGPESDVAALGSVLAGAPLAQHQQWAAELERQGGYREFAHEIDPDTVRTLSQTDDRAVVEATVREVATERAHNTGNQAGVVLYEANLRVRYELVAAESGSWKISGIQVLEKLSQD